MTNPGVADRGDGPDIRRVAVNILSKQSLAADESQSSSRAGLGATISTQNGGLARITAGSFVTVPR
jgi:hypothetical protein